MVIRDANEVKRGDVVTIFRQLLIVTRVDDYTIMWSDKDGDYYRGLSPYILQRLIDENHAIVERYEDAN